MAMSKYENIIWEEKIIDKIRSKPSFVTPLYISKLTQSGHALILYSRELTPDSILYVLNSTSKLPGYALVTYTSHVVTINAPTSTAWKVLFSSQDCMSLEECMEETLRTLQERLRPRLRKSSCTYFYRVLLYFANAMYLQSLMYSRRPRSITTWLGVLSSRNVLTVQRTELTNNA